MTRRQIRYLALLTVIVLTGMVSLSPRTLAAGIPRSSLPDGGVWVDTDKEKALDQLFIEAVRPQIRTALTGVYGTELPFWQEKITKVQRHKKYPDVLRVVIQVQTYEGAHNPVGIDELEFILEPPHFLHIEHAAHLPHPQAAPKK